MYSRLLAPPADKSFFLFGPRGTGKSWWVKTAYPKAVYIDLLDAETHTRLLAAPGRLAEMIPPDYRGPVVIDEVQKAPALLDEVHRLIENRRIRFVLTGSSARKLRRGGVNLLAGRALTTQMFPLTAAELGEDFDLKTVLRNGCLPAVHVEKDAAGYLQSYVATYLREEVQQEGLTRNLAAFTRFLEAASFSQAQVLNVSAVARECGVERKVVEQYFGILEDLMLAVRVPVFSRRARRDVAVHPKFFLFDVGVFRTVRPRGPLDSPEEIDGAALETLLLQEVRALNSYRRLGYQMSYWRTHGGLEVDLVLYGERGLHAFEVKRQSRVRSEDLRGLHAFGEDYTMARLWLLYTGTRRDRAGRVEILPIDAAIRELGTIL